MENDKPGEQAEDSLVDLETSDSSVSGYTRDRPLPPLYPSATGMEDDLIREAIHELRVGPDCALGSRTRWRSKCHCVAKRNQSDEDLICDHYRGGDFKFVAAVIHWRDIARHPSGPVKCFDVLLEKVGGDGDCP